MHTPYIIVPKVGQLETTEDDCEASVVEMDAEGVELSVSLDHGSTWQAVETAQGRNAYDLTRHVAGTYGYLLRVGLRGNPQEALVRNLALTTWVQVAPASLPGLRSGSKSDGVLLGRPLWAAESCGHALFRYEPAGNPSSAGCPDARRLRSGPEDGANPRDVVARLSAAPGTRIAWFTAEGSFRTHQQEAARQTRNTMAYAVDQPADFKQIYRADMPTDMGHWHYNAAREVRLDPPPKRSMFATTETRQSTSSKSTLTVSTSRQGRRARSSLRTCGARTAKRNANELR